MHFFFDFDETLVWHDHRINKLSKAQIRNRSDTTRTKDVDSTSGEDPFTYIEGIHPLYLSEHRCFFEARYSHKDNYPMSILTRSSKEPEAIREILSEFYGDYFEDVKIVNKMGKLP